MTMSLPLEKGSEFRSEEQEQDERQLRVQECRAIRLQRARELAEKYGTESSKKNPTASYEHCLMRVRTMNEKGLQNRVKAIERVAGKHCIVKMGKLAIERPLLGSMIRPRCVALIENVFF